MVPLAIVQGQSTLDGGLNSTVEVFGEWQTEVYMAPPVVDVSSLTLSLLSLSHSLSPSSYNFLFFS